MRTLIGAQGLNGKRGRGIKRHRYNIIFNSVINILF